ncbi:MAG: hypothetical protein RL339_993 [Pseudomonadota bacterium]|jgi:hypothetical protein
MHLAFCFIFIFFYCIGFGNGIENFFSYSDVFSVSMKDLSWAYFIFLAQIAAVTIFMVKFEIPGRDKSNEAIGGFFYGVFIAYVITYALIAAFVLFLFVRMFILFHEISSWLMATFLIIVLGIWGSNNLRANRSALRALITLLIGLPLIVSAYHGMSKGFLDAYGSVPKEDSDAATCGKRIVIRSIGDYYLAHDKNGAKFLIDKECVDRFTLLSEKKYAREVNKFNRIWEF